MRDTCDFKDDSPSDKYMPGLLEGEKGMGDSYFKVIPSMPDYWYILAYSIMPSYISYHDSKCGSWFIQHLKEAIKKLAAT